MTGGNLQARETPGCEGDNDLQGVRWKYLEPLEATAATDQRNYSAQN